MLSRHHTRPLTLLAAVAWALLMLAALGIAGAQEGDDPLSRYDSPTTREMVRQYEENEKRAAEIEAEIARLEENFDYGAERDALMDELADMPSSTQMDNAIGDARLSDIESAPLPDDPERKAAELRRKAASLDALDRCAQTSEIDVDSRLYGILGGGDAEALAATYREEAGAIELAENSEEVAQEKKDAAEEAAKEAAPEPDGEEGAGGARDGGGEKPAEEEPEPQPEPAPDEGGAGEDSGRGPLTGIGSAVSGFSLTSLLAAALIACGIVYYLVGLLREGVGERVKRLGAPQQARAPKPKSKPGGKTGGRTGSRPKDTPETSGPETPRDGERTSKRPERESPEKPQQKPSTKTEEPKDGAALADRLKRMRKQGPSADDVETPTAEELADLFDREDDDGEGR